MGFYWDTSSLGTYLKAEDINSVSDAMFTFINEGIGNNELKSAEDIPSDAPKSVVYEKKGWIDPKIIYRPEFYGSPSPRMMAVSGQTHWRETPNNWSKGSVFNVELSGT